MNACVWDGACGTEDITAWRCILHDPSQWGAAPIQVPNLCCVLQLWCQDLCCVGILLIVPFTTPLHQGCDLRVLLNDIFSSTTQTFLFLTSSTWWHRALLQASADISHYIQGFWWMFFGLGVNQITGMCPALCYALRLALLSHDVSLRFQSIISCWYVL